jgi:hypothetical protein
MDAMEAMPPLTRGTSRHVNTPFCSIAVFSLLSRGLTVFFNGWSPAGFTFVDLSPPQARKSFDQVVKSHPS